MLKCLPKSRHRRLFVITANEGNQTAATPLLRLEIEKNFWKILQRLFEKYGESVK